MSQTAGREPVQPHATALIGGFTGDQPMDQAGRRRLRIPPERKEQPPPCVVHRKEDLFPFRFHPKQRLDAYSAGFDKLLDGGDDGL